jgi:hypothetical protein
MVLAIRDDSGLSRWFESLKRLRIGERRIEIYRMRRKLMGLDAGEADEMAAYLVLLADERVFSAALTAYESL